MRTKSKKVIFSLLAIVLVLTLAIGTDYGSSASKEVEKRSSLIEGINKINIETMELYQSKMKRFDKLSNDLEDFKANGSSGIKESNILYLTNKTGFTASELDSGLAGTKLEGLGEDFKLAEDETGVNAILLMAMAKHESGNGTSLLADEKNNLFGFNAIDQDPINAANKFKDKGESIMHVAEFLKSNYLTKDGRFYNGISTEGIGQLYASDPQWSNKVSNMMIEVSSNMLAEFEKAGN